MTLQSDERLALAYWCLAHGSTRPIRVLPTADQIAIVTDMAEIRAEHRRTAIRLAGGRDACRELLDSMTRENQQ